jgi:hypothetical protein
MSNLTATQPVCKGGQLCTSINNSGPTPVTVTVDFFVNAEHLTKPVTIPANDAVTVCVSATTTGSAVVSVEVNGQQLAVRAMQLPCP